MPGLTPGYEAPEALSKREQPHHTPYVSRWVLTKLIVLGVAAKVMFGRLWHQLI